LITPCSSNQDDRPFNFNQASLCLIVIKGPSLLPFSTSFLPSPFIAPFIAEVEHFARQVLDQASVPVFPDLLT
jgi:hypothetical protein